LGRADVKRWLERYVAAWKSGDRDEIGDLFAADARYRYHPYDEPVEGREAIVGSWLEDPDTPGTFEAGYECVAVDVDAAVAVGTSTYRDQGGEVTQVFDNAFLLRFDPDGRCCDFTEWYMKRPS
jgi:ketosteroid isomerase-like protein